MVCDETRRVAMYSPPCTGWIDTGFPWHACNLSPDHDHSMSRIEHHCPCGHRWTTRKPTSTDKGNEGL